MLTRKSLQILFSYILLFSVIFCVFFLFQFLLSGSKSALDSRSPLLSLVLELKETVSKQTSKSSLAACSQSEEINQLRLITSSFEDSVATYKKELFLLKKKLSKDPIPVDSNLKRYALDPVFEGSPPSEDAHGLVVVSKMCTQGDFHADWFFEACLKLEMSFSGRRRKAWEYAYVLAVFGRFGLIKSDARALVIGELNQPLTQHLASEGVYLTLMEESESKPLEGRALEQKLLEWRPSRMALKHPKLNAQQSAREYLDHIAYRTHHFGGDTRLASLLPSTLCDMVWSTGFIEAMENVEVGKDFILDSLQALRPGGVAVHVLDLILEPRADPDQDAALGGIPKATNAESAEGVVLWRHHDVKQLRDLLCTQGYNVKKLHFGIGSGFYDVHPDKPPYGEANHIKLLLNGHVVTSYALVIEHPKEGLAEGGMDRCE